MLHWIAANKFRDGSSSALHPSQTTYQALLSSTIADGDVVTDWIYFFDIFYNDENIPQWLLTLQLASCICGTLSWLSVATDGRLVHWMKAVPLWLIIVLICIVLLPIAILQLIIRLCFGEDNKVSLYLRDVTDWIADNVLFRLFISARQKPSFSSSTLLFFGIIVEDIPQLVVTFLIEDKIKSDDPTGRISGAAIVNLTFAIFDILHKLAEACDLLSDVHNAGYAYKQWIKAHSGHVVSLAVAGSNQIVSASASAYGVTVKLWDTTKGKLNFI